MKTVYFIRHAESVGNEKGILTGQLDLPLTSAGEAAAREASKHWQTLEPEVVYCSTLKRSQQTARLLFPNAALVIDRRINERYFGDWQGRSKNDLKGYYPGVFLKNGKMDIDYTPPYAEPYGDFLKRLQYFLKDIATVPERAIACVTHAGILRALTKLPQFLPSNSAEPSHYLFLCGIRVTIRMNSLYEYECLCFNQAWGISHR